MPRRFFTLDVFADRALAGNPLAVVIDAAGLDDARMQAIAREFNLSETVFVLAPGDPAHAAAVRIFTPTLEMPFAGHPTIGTAALIAHLRAPDLMKTQEVAVTLEEKVGDIACRARRDEKGALAAEFDLPRPPERSQGEPPPAAEIAAALDLEPEDIDFDGHAPSLFSAGAPYLFAPLRSLAAVRRASPKAWSAAGRDPIFVYSREVEAPGSAFHARMFAGAWGVHEDPATGSAAAAFAGVVLAFERPRDGRHRLVIEQGFEMGRPSLIALSLEVEGGALRKATIGGAAVIVSSGALEL
ncbi:MAG: PhzF family phenazine biosynthesis protein [Hyphomicrobiales bacterium]|nr:PhzF family phenazine biosynthesis protein [Hyphomicrobiales bacterium]